MSESEAAEAERVIAVYPRVRLAEWANLSDEWVRLIVAEAAFYDAIVQNDAAILTMGDDTLKKIAADLVTQVQNSITIDWNFKASVKAEMRAKVRRLLAKYDYSPDLEEKGVELVLQQAKLFTANGKEES
ncbi:hypothetical protein AXFE_24780 [Acidithrix ferrooxidans]|uniref:Type I restriction enzyme HindI endonuclease subunit-like C-terminal domain-containing protein n=1 Tax=Acidithrix ferrooxidans TaxID=1280514 RepID=A0A0D8HHR2_9ACTN|nr:type I restriction enzyme endonuclease domain-containing protein [Acidithrix ferrooxidans]KJF16616.1 hypothetical protein AXFE_24780 [Acidithrix ferrooxidans]